MVKLSQAQKIVNFLKANPMEKFTARQIAETITDIYRSEYSKKRKNPRFEDEKAFIQQIVAEIGAQKEQIVKHDNHVFWQDKPRPRVFWYDPHNTFETEIQSDIDLIENEEVISIPKSTCSEEDLYLVLIDYLKFEQKLYCYRIRESTSKNTRGKNGNKWLHPDIVAIQPVDHKWDSLIKTCLKQGAGERVRLWSFEVKIDLTTSNVRKYFFQAVSNSSWANEGYLVAKSISSDVVEQELRMLSALHGIGIIILDPENPSESEMLFPARPKTEVDWQSVDRIVKENSDFKEFIELVSDYYQTDRIKKRDWNKIPK